MRISTRTTAVLFLLAGSGALAEPSEAPQASLKRFEYQQVLMGVPVRILVYAPAESLANAAVHEAFDRIRHLNAVFSDYDEDSEVSKLCAASGPGRPVPASAELRKVLAAALDLSRRSDGAFDVTVGPFVELWRKARRSKQLPSAEAIAAARERVGYQAVRIDDAKGEIELGKPRMRLDFGGIVKGYAADEAREVLKAKGLPIALVALSGDMSAGDAPPGQPGWRVAIPGGTSADDPATQSIWLKNAAVSTSGGAQQFVEIGGRRYSHLVDPKTGLGMTRGVSVTVVAPRGITSDGVDSTAAVLGGEKGLRLIADTPGAQGRIIEQTENGTRTLETPGFKSLLAPPVAAVRTSAP